MAANKDFYELQQQPVSSNNAYPIGDTFDPVDHERHADKSGNSAVHTGVSADPMDMRRMGRKQELRRNFKSISILGLAAETMATWISMLMVNVFPSSTEAWLARSGCTSRAGSVRRLLWRVWRKWRVWRPRAAGSIGWQAVIAGGSYSTSALTLQLASFNNPSYVPQNWHVTLMMIGVASSATLFNTFGAKQLPFLEGIVLFFHILGFFAIIIPLWIMAPKAPASEVFGSFSNFGGYSSIGTACFVGTIAATSSFAGSDAPAHLAEEVKDASRAVPRMMVATILLNGTMGSIMIITYVFCITNLEVVLASESAFAFVDVFYAATASKAGATAMACLPLVITAYTTLNALAAASRQAWALSRDGGLPFSGWFQRIVTIGTPIPINAISFSLSIVTILVLINLGSSTAFNSIVGLLTSATCFSYALSIGCVLLRRIRGPALPHARWSLGSFRILINIFAIGYVITAAVASFFPTAVPVEASSMNWSIVMFVGVFTIATIDYVVRGRKRYTGPVVRIYRD